MRLFRLIAPSTTTRLLLAVVIVATIAAHPVSAHALSIGSIAAGAILDVFLSVISYINSLLSMLLNSVNQALQWILTLKITTNITVVDAAWKLLRDICNMGFIILIILIAFGTIFNSVGWLQNFYYKKAIVPLIVAALVMNFSLAIGKAVVGVSNEATRLLLNVMPANWGDSLTKTLRPQAFAAKRTSAATIAQPAGPASAPAANASPMDKIKAALSEAEKKRFDACVQEEDPNSISTAGRVADVDPLMRWIRGVVKEKLGIEKVRKSIGVCMGEIEAARAGKTPEEIADRMQANAEGRYENKEKLQLIFSGLFLGILLVMLTLCLFSAFLFMGIRIIMIWVLLFLSPVAWFTYAVPSFKEKGFGQWWNLFKGWNLFGPLYVLTLIPGMMMLIGSGEVLTSISAAAETGNGLADAGQVVVQTVFFYGFTLIIFVGGLGVAMKSSFLKTVSDGPLGGLVKRTGITDMDSKFQRYSVGAAGRLTGATSAGQWIGAGAQASKEKLMQGAAGAYRKYAPGMMQPGTYEEKLAQARARFGVAGGAKEMESIYGFSGTKIKERTGELDKRIYGMKEDDKIKFLMSRVNSKDKAEALAARNMLIKNGWNTDDAFIQETRDMYPEGVARDEFNRQIAFGAKKRAEKAKETEVKKKITETLDNASIGNAADIEQALAASNIDPADTQKVGWLLKEVSKKNPSAVIDYHVAHGGTTPQKSLEAFEHVLNNPSELVKLGSDYFDPSKQQFADLQTNIDRIYPPGNPPGTPEYQRREDFKSELLRLGKTKAGGITNLIP